MKQNYHVVALEKKNIGEADRLYTFYSLERGLMRVPARSIRKSKARLASQVEDFMVSHITIAQNRGNGTLAGAVAEKYFVALHQNHIALDCVDNVRNIFLTVIDENDDDRDLFTLFVEYLTLMDDFAAQDISDKSIAQLQWITHAFLLQLFALQGYRFGVKKCCVCHKYIKEMRHSFSAEKGGVVCAPCLYGGHSYTVDPDTLKALRLIQHNNLSHLTKVVVHRKVHIQLSQIINDIERWVMR